MPKRTLAEEEALVADIQSRFAAGETLTAIRAHYPNEYSLGELKQIVQGQSKRATDSQPMSANTITPSSGTGRGPR